MGGAEGDADGVGQAVGSHKAHEDLSLKQPFRDLLGPGTKLDEDEVGFRGCVFEVERLQGVVVEAFRCPVVGEDGGEANVVVERGAGGENGDEVDAEGLLRPVEKGDKLCVAYPVSDSEAGETVGLGKGPQDEDGVLFYKGECSGEGFALSANSA